MGEPTSQTKPSQWVDSVSLAGRVQYTHCSSLGHGRSTILEVKGGGEVKPGNITGEDENPGDR